MINRIVVPLDRSSVSESALPLARLLASQLAASVTLVSVIDVPNSFTRHVPHAGSEPAPAEPQRHRGQRIAPQSPFGNWSGSPWSEPSSAQIDEVAQETSEAERYLRTIADTFTGQHVTTSVQLGTPAQRILETAEVREDSLIVLASHGRSGIRRAVVGSVAERVVQAATTPVIVVRAASEPDNTAELTPIRKVLVPIDGSTFAEQAIPVVQQIFGAEKLEIHLARAIETPRLANIPYAENYARWLSEQVTASGTPTTWEVRESAPAELINQAADAQGADLIAMTTHGRSGLDRFVLGSVAERVLNNAEKPLLLVPSRAQ